MEVDWKHQIIKDFSKSATAAIKFFEESLNPKPEVQDPYEEKLETYEIKFFHQLYLGSRFF